MGGGSSGATMGGDTPPPAAGSAAPAYSDPGEGGQHVPLGQVADIRIVTGPPMIRDEQGMLVGYAYVDMDVAKRDIGGYVDEAKRAVRARLASLQQEWEEDLLPEKIEAVIALEGVAAETILLEAERAAADMILVFHHRRGPLRRVLLGSVAQQVVSEARIPVVVLPIAGGRR